ncbi:MAG: hypothetical protein RL095_2525 [Verrucomicrobiota bacterium]|jgi:hypothetical protein
MTPRLFFYALILCLLPPARADEHEAAKTVKSYKEKYHDGNEKTFDDLSSQLAQLAKSGDTGTGKFLVGLAADRRLPHPIRGLAMRSLVSMKGNPEVNEELRHLAAKSGCCPQILDVLARLKEPGTESLFIPHLASKDRASVMAALLGLSHCGGLKDASLLPRLAKMAAPPAPTGLRWAVCAALGGSRQAAAIPLLIDMYELPDTSRDARKALIRLTGEKLSGKSTWTEWWKTQGKSFAAKDEFELAEKTLAAEAAEGAFYGLPIEGHRIVFHLDRSLSMEGESMDRLKTECENMSQCLDPSREFALIFCPYLAIPKNGFLKGDESGKATMLKALKTVPNKGTTPLANIATTQVYQDLLGKGKILPDTVYILSDGCFTDAVAQGEMDCLFLALYPGNSVRIHYIHLGHKGKGEFGRKAAREHGGIYIDTETKGGKNKGGKAKNGKKNNPENN